MVTHDQEEAMSMASRVGIMDAGLIRQVGAPFEIYAATHELVAENLRVNERLSEHRNNFV